MAFNDARQAVPSPEVTRVAPPRAQDSTTAAAIEAFGEFGGELRKGQLEGKLKTRLGSLANTVSAIDEQAQITEETGIQPTFAELGADKIDQTTDQFNRLRRERAQGRLSDAAVDFEAEVILKQAVNSAPGFAPEFRSLAKSIIGRDPTGSGIRALIGAATQVPEERRRTLFDDMMERAELFSTGLGLPLDQTLRSVIAAEFAPTQEALIDFEFKRAETALPSIIQETSNRLNVRAGPVFAQMLAEIDEHGGVINGEDLARRFRQDSNNVIRNMANVMANPEGEFKYSTEQIGQMRQTISQDVTNFLANLKDEDYVDMLARKRQGVSDALQLNGFNAYGELAAMRLGGGGEAQVDFHLRMMDIARGNPETLASLRAEIPSFKMSSDFARQKGKIAEGISIIMGDLPFPIRLTDDMAEVIDVETDVGALSPDDIVYARSVMTMMQERKKPQRAITFIAQTAGSYNRFKPEERADIQSEAVQIRSALIDKMILANVGTNWLVGFRDGEFKLIDRQGATFDTTQVVEGSRFVGSPPGLDPINRLNKTLFALFNSDGRWLRDQGTTMQEFIENTVTTVNSRIAISETLLEPKLANEAAFRQGLTLDQQDKIAESATMEELFSNLQEAGIGDFSDIQSETLVEMQPGFFSQGNDIVQVTASGQLVRNPQGQVTGNIPDLNKAEQALVDLGKRRLGTNQAIDNSDGSQSTIRSTSVRDDRLNNGKITLIPSIVDGKAETDVNVMIEAALESGLTFPTFDTEAEATAASKRISAAIKGNGKLLD